MSASKQVVKVTLILNRPAINLPVFRFIDQMDVSLSTGPANLAPFTRAQLALRNGQDRSEIWCAYAGIIYDVSASRLWRNGLHYQHWAGQDLTTELDDAPHSAAVFGRFKAVGRLI